MECLTPRPFYAPQADGEDALPVQASHGEGAVSSMGAEEQEQAPLSGWPLTNGAGVVNTNPFSSTAEERLPAVDGGGTNPFPAEEAAAPAGTNSFPAEAGEAEALAANADGGSGATAA
mmetsp:Transcript_81317/g.209324  ORF Transcript_81317/g.209324 Transcript_81317/m.209324 type:complete len:118 (-) Transcript_81317:35-388(-)